MAPSPLHSGFRGLAEAAKISTLAVKDATVMKRMPRRGVLHVRAWPPVTVARYTRAVRNRSAFVITDTDEKLIARAAINGLSSRPVSGYRIPAAIGIPRAL